MRPETGQRVEVRRQDGVVLGAIVRELAGQRAALELLEERASLEPGGRVDLYYLGHDTLYAAGARVAERDGAAPRRYLVDLDPEGPRRIQRRRHFRVEATLQVSYEVELRSGSGRSARAPAPLTGTAHSRNLSAGGILVSLPAPLPAGTRVALRFSLDDGGDDLTLRARVIRSTPRRLAHLVAMEFLDPGEPVRARITRFLLRLQAQRASGQWLPAHIA